jgi:hypothetical protein
VGSSEDKHPADELALALSRASGILSSIANCYDPSQSEFATSAAFVAEAVTAASDILTKANANLGQLYSNYSLQRLDDQDLVVTLPLRNEVAAHNPYEEKIVPRSAVAELSNKLDTILSVLPEERPFAQRDQPARTYDELLYKLTAMTNVAATQQNSESDLLPMLESLRADMLRIRTVA